MPLISHGGAAGLAPENSLESITIANRYFPAYIEVDVHRTEDGVYILHHGAVRQTWTGKPHPETYEVVKQKNPRIVTLESVLQHPTAAPLLLDIKCAEQIEDFIEILRTNSVPENTAFTSPHANALYAVKTAFPTAKTFIAQPYHHGPIEAIELARDFGFSGISLNKWWLSPFVAWLCKKYQKEFTVYTIDNFTWIWLAQKLFPQAYICTNRPDQYRKHFAAPETTMHA